MEYQNKLETESEKLKLEIEQLRELSKVLSVLTDCNMCMAIILLVASFVIKVARFGDY